MSSAPKHYRYGEIMPAAECRYCHGSGHVTVLRNSGVLRLPALVPVPCAHRIGDPFNEQGRASRLSRLLSTLFFRRGRT